MNLMPEIHNAYANFRLSPLGHYFKIGHFDIPFGLEPLLDTHPTILQTQATKNVGFKRDWGLSLNGQGPSFDYELSATIGSGGATKIWRKDGSYLLAGRVGSPTDTLQYGLSLLYGEVLMALYDDYLSDETVSRKRLGLDLQYEYESFLLKGELACGQDEDRDVLGESKSDDTILTLGTSYKLNEAITFRFAWSHDFNLMWGREDDVFTMQVYYYSE